MSPRIRRLVRANIDTGAWDAAVAADDRPLPYGLSGWLDAGTDGRWDGLILDDYRAVLPLPYRLKLFNRPWLLPPPFTQQQGPFGRWSDDDAAALLAAVPNCFGRGSLHLRIGGGLERINQVIDLSPPHEDILAGYSRSLRKRLRRAQPSLLAPASPTLVTELYRRQLGEKTGLKDRHYSIIQRLATVFPATDCWQLTDEEGLLAAGFFPSFAGRTVNLFAAATSHGDQNMGMARLLDALIRERAGRAGWFDFEGSNIPGVHAFFRSFGAMEDNYRRVIF